MNKTIKPSEDFYHYVNGNLLAKTEIPNNEVSCGNFTELEKGSRANMLKILNEAVKDPGYKSNTDLRKTNCFFNP